MLANDFDYGVIDGEAGIEQSRPRGQKATEGEGRDRAGG